MDVWDELDTDWLETIETLDDHDMVLIGRIATEEVIITDAMIPVLDNIGRKLGIDCTSMEVAPMLVVGGIIALVAVAVVAFLAAIIRLFTKLVEMWTGVKLPSSKEAGDLITKMGDNIKANTKEFTDNLAKVSKDIEKDANGLAGVKATMEVEVDGEKKEVEIPVRVVAGQVEVLREVFLVAVEVHMNSDKTKFVYDKTGPLPDKEKGKVHDLEWISYYYTKLEEYTARRKKFVEDVLGSAVSTYGQLLESISRELDNTTADLSKGLDEIKGQKYKTWDMPNMGIAKSYNENTIIAKEHKDPDWSGISEIRTLAPTTSPVIIVNSNKFKFGSAVQTIRKREEGISKLVADTVKKIQSDIESWNKENAIKLQTIETTLSAVKSPTSAKVADKVKKIDNVAVRKSIEKYMSAGIVDESTVEFLGLTIAGVKAATRVVNYMKDDIGVFTRAMQKETSIIGTSSLGKTAPIHRILKDFYDDDIMGLPEKAEGDTQIQVLAVHLRMGK